MVKGTLVSDIKHDINPKSWLSKYQRNSLTYILLMFLFYIAISNAALHASSLIATYFNLPYRESYSSIFDEVFTGVLAGPLEDTWFFAIPLFTAVGNPFIVLASGIMWSVIHIFKGEVLGYDNFYIFANAIETIPALFFILRTWASGKGWFSIILHSTYDVILALSICSFLDKKCMNLSEYNSIYDVLVSTVPAALLLITTYYIYKNRNKSQLPSATKFFQGKEIVQISIYLAILMGISSILYYFSLSALSLVVFVTLGCMLLLNVMTRDPDDAERNRSFYAKNLKWLLVYVGVNFLIIYLLPFYISWIGTIGVFFLLTYKRKDKTRIRDAGHILLFKSKKEQWSWTGIFLLLVYVNFYHPFSVNIIYTYWFCLLICRYLLLSFGSRRIISPL